MSKITKLLLNCFLLAFSFFALAKDSVSQDETSAFIDPFNPLKKTKENANPDEKASNSFFPKIPTPKMPKLPPLPNLNPFAKRSPSSGANSSKSNTSFFQQMNASTKSFFTKTTHTLMPWTKPKNANPQGAIVPAFMQKEKSADKPKTGIQLMNFFSPLQSEKKVETTGDFFRQDRPGFRK